MNALKNNTLNCPSILTGMSHEMRTHMNAIVAFSFLMKGNGLNNNDSENFSNQIFNACEQLIMLFDSFLDSAIIETGGSSADSRTCILDNILDDFLAESREVIKKEGYKDIELVTEIQFNDSAEVSIDKARVIRVIRSLFQNSLKSTKSGYIKIGYHLEEDDLTFYVLDSGQGYFKSKEFLQTDDLNTSLAQHNDTYTAINITLARKLIQLLGGNIWIECNGLAGAGIYFTIPAKVITRSKLNINKYANSLIAI